VGKVVRRELAEVVGLHLLGLLDPNGTLRCWRSPRRTPGQRRDRRLLPRHLLRPGARSRPASYRQRPPRRAPGRRDARMAPGGPTRPDRSRMNPAKPEPLVLDGGNRRCVERQPAALHEPVPRGDSLTNSAVRSPRGRARPWRRG
jgi:hypothetical protein